MYRYLETLVFATLLSTCLSCQMRSQDVDHNLTTNINIHIVRQNVEHVTPFLLKLWIDGSPIIDSRIVAESIQGASFDLSVPKGTHSMIVEIYGETKREVPFTIGDRELFVKINSWDTEFVAGETRPAQIEISFSDYFQPEY